MGDVVLMKDDKLIRGHWRLGKVTKTITASDGKVRTVTVGYKQVGAKRFTYVERSSNSLIIVVPVEE